MLSILIALLAALAAWSAVYFGWSSDHWGWALTAAIVAFLGISLIINLILRKRLNDIFTRVQKHIMDSQDKLRKRVMLMQNKFSNQQKLMEFAEKEQATSVHEAIDMLDEAKPYYKWNFLTGRQVDTMKGQLYFQLKEFEEADKCLAHSFLMDPLIVAMKMTRMYKNKQMKELEKAFHKGVGRFKYEKGLLIYAVYAWALIHENRIDEAITVLAEGKDKTENAVLKQNWDHLVNNHVKRVSFVGLGDQWLALYLENPPAVRQQAQLPFGGRPTRGGFR